MLTSTSSPRPILLATTLSLCLAAAAQVSAQGVAGEIDRLPPTIRLLSAPVVAGAPTPAADGPGAYYDTSLAASADPPADNQPTGYEPAPEHFPDHGEPGSGWHTTGAPVLGDGGFFFEQPNDPPTARERLLELLPTTLTKPHNPVGNMFARLLCAERVEVETELHHEPLGLQPIPERPPLLVELNERFLGPGVLAAGFETPAGAVWRPSVWVFGEYRTAFSYFDNKTGPPVAEWANRLDLFTQLNLTGTERILWGYRVLDEEVSDGTARRFAGYDFRNGRGLPGGNFDIQTLFFEGDLGELFPRLDPNDFMALDYGFSVGRMPLLAQQGLLLNDDIIDAVTLTRNTLVGYGNLNLRVTGVYAWDKLSRNSPIAGNPNREDNNSRMVALLTESDFAKNTINADVAYVYGDSTMGDLLAYGVSAIRRHYLCHNTYNSSIHYLASHPINGSTPYAQRGHLLFGQFSWTPHHYFDVIYVNAFWAVDRFTSPTRGPLTGSPLGTTGILLAHSGLGRYGPPIAVRTNDMAGGSLGYQWFFDGTRKQLIWEIGGAAETEGVGVGQIGTALRYQQAFGQHLIWVMDSFVTKREGANAGAGGRAELRVKF